MGTFDKCKLDIESGEELLAQARQEGDRHMTALYLGELGRLYADEHGNPLMAIKYLDEGRQIFESLHEWDNAAALCNRLAGCYEAGLGDLSLATKYMGIAASIAENESKKIEYQNRCKKMQERRNGFMA